MKLKERLVEVVAVGTGGGATVKEPAGRLLLNVYLTSRFLGLMIATVTVTDVPEGMNPVELEVGEKVTDRTNTSDNPARTFALLSTPMGIGDAHWASTSNPVPTQRVVRIRLGELHRSGIPSPQIDQDLLHESFIGLTILIRIKDLSISYY